MSIVIVDDNVTNLVVLKHLAKGQAEQEIHAFTHPEKALDHLAQNRADLVVVDCDMPGLNGIDFTESLRKQHHHSQTPIVMVTAHSEEDVRTRAVAAGVTDFLTKPVNAEEFRLRLRNLLRLTA